MRIRKLTAALLALAVAGCGDAANGRERTLTGPEGALPRTNVVVTNVLVCCANTVYQGSSYQVYATAIDQYGHAISNPSVTWTAGSGVVSVAGAGQYATVYAVSPGLSTVNATVGGVTGSASVTVRAPAVVTTVQVTPSPLTVNTGTTQTLTARAYNQYGEQMSGQTATWSTASSGVATVSSTGVVTGVAPGTTTITATIAGKTATVNVTVQNPITTNGIYGTGMILSEGTYSWGLSPVSGGNGTYAYQWEIDWYDTPFEGFIPVGGGDSYSRAVTGCDGSFEIRVRIFSGGASTSVNHIVENYASGYCW